jgi:ketosteroid isomerase-like protein
MKTMFRMLFLSIAALAVASCAPPANTNTTTNSNANANTAAKPAAPTADSLMALDQKAWEAYKNKDGKYFEGFLGDNMISGTGQGSMSKADVVKMIAENKDEIKSFTLSEARVTPAGADVAVLTYKAVIDGTENGKPIPSPSTVATVFVRSGSDWKAVYHEEVAVIDPAKAGSGNSNAAPSAANSKPAAPPMVEKKESPASGNSNANSNAAAGSNSNTGSSSTGDAALTDALMVVEKKGWEGWKAKDAKALDEVTTGGSSFVFVDPMGQASVGKDAAMKTWADPSCSVSNVALSDGKGYSLAKDAAILVYKGTATGTCGGMKLEPIWGTTVFVKEGEAWKAAYIFEQPVE